MISNSITPLIPRFSAIKTVEHDERPGEISVGADTKGEIQNVITTAKKAGYGVNDEDTHQFGLHSNGDLEWFVNLYKELDSNSEPIPLTEVELEALDLFKGSTTYEPGNFDANV